MGEASWQLLLTTPSGLEVSWEAIPADFVDFHFHWVVVVVVNIFTLFLILCIWCFACMYACVLCSCSAHVGPKRTDVVSPWNWSGGSY